MRLSDLGTLLDEEGNLDNIYEYFNNQAFVDANRGRSFTPMEQIAIIIHSDAPSISLEQKFRDLRELAARVDDDIKEEIEYYIDLKQKMVEFVKTLNDDRFMFHIPYGGRVSNPKIFRTYEDALKGNCAIPIGITIEKVFDDSKEQYPQGNCGYINFVTVGRCGEEIADINISGELYLMANLPKRHLKINDISVKFNSPFKPYDFVITNEHFCYNIVADVTDDELSKLREEFYNSPYGECRKHCWIEVDLPHCFVDNYDKSIHTLCQSRFFGALSKIKVVDREDMTLGRLEQIEEIKKLIAKENNH